MIMRLWLDELARLPEYSTTMPTSVCAWKTWKARTWQQGDVVSPTGPFVVRQYGESFFRDGKARCRNLQFEVVLLQGPRRGNEALRFKTACTRADDAWEFPSHGAYG